MAAGLDNRAAASPTRSETEIIRDNIFTFFNLVFIVLALCLAALVAEDYNPFLYFRF